MNNILVVDQSNILRLQVRSIISSPEINVVEASEVGDVINGSFANQYSLGDIDLLILDIQFGEEEDFSLLNYFQQQDINLPIIILSSNDRRETVLKAYRFGALDYLLKPFDGQVLKSKVDYYLIEDDKTQAQISNYSQKNDIIDYFKLELLQELSRTLRGESEFSILKVVVKQNEQAVVTKDLLLSLMRGIDKIYKITETEFLLLVPLTNKAGAKILFERLNNYLVEHLGEEEISLDLLMTFPEDITKVIEKDKIVEYQHHILTKLFNEN